MVNIALLGPPGSGKGSYGRFLAQALKAKLVTASDVLRHSPDPLIRDAMTQGALVDDDKVCETLHQFLIKQKRKPHQRILLDGFPRTLAQTQKMQQTWPSPLQIHGAILLDVPRQVCRAKLLGRRLCLKCGGNYNVANVEHGFFVLPPYLPRDCDCRQERWVEREDDRPHLVDHRLNLYFQTIPAVLNHFASNHDKLLRWAPHRGHDPKLESILQEWLLQIDLCQSPARPTQNDII